MNNKMIVLILLLLTSSVFGVESELQLDGQFIQGGLVIGHTEKGAKVSFQDKKVKVSKDGIFIIGFHRDEPLRSVLNVRLKSGKQLKKDIVIQKRDYKIQRIDGLPPSKVTPRKSETIKRIKAESALARNARKLQDDRLDFLETFIWPATGPISGVYGSQRVLNGEPRRPHFGIDIARPTGTPVVAPASGIITMAHDDMFFSGGTLILDHGHGLSSSFLHLSKILVKVGDKIKQGDLIAKIGATGRVTGAHLDWRMNLGKKRVDPELLVPEMPTSSTSGK